ncbi:MAG: M15 family metallopeptidase [Eubacterium sp.]|nr:M15 family metallopeptidase [Eubacterium sp.]
MRLDSKLEEKRKESRVKRDLQILSYLKGLCLACSLLSVIAIIYISETKPAYLLTQTASLFSTTDPYSIEETADTGSDNIRKNNTESTVTSSSSDTVPSGKTTATPAPSAAPTKAATPTPTPTPKPTPVPELPSFLTTRTTDWNMLLVNKEHLIPDGFTIETTVLSDGVHEADSRCAADLEAMIADCAAAGNTPIICSAYRAHETQVELFNERVGEEEAANGTDAAAAAEAAGTAVAVPGTSEHEIGLAFDIYSSENQTLDDSQEQTATQQWLMANCAKYGFILRYPRDKMQYTGIIYEPWHYRYVGREAAADITANGLCLEEYLDKLSSWEASLNA